MICQEEMEQVHEAKAPGQAEEWGAAWMPAAEEAVVLRQAPAVTAYARIVEKE